MRPQDLTLRCYAEQEGECLWVAVCIDLCLAAQGSSYREARRRLISQINVYVYDAMVGEDRAYAYQLLRRKAPLWQQIKYHLIRARLAGLLFRHRMRIFISNLRLIPVSPRHAV
jgi:hypothetical protein